MKNTLLLSLLNVSILVVVSACSSTAEENESLGTQQGASSAQSAVACSDRNCTGSYMITETCAAGQSLVVDIEVDAGLTITRGGSADKDANQALSYVGGTEFHFGKVEGAISRAQPFDVSTQLSSSWEGLTSYGYNIRLGYLVTPRDADPTLQYNLRVTVPEGAQVFQATYAVLCN